MLRSLCLPLQNPLPHRRRGGWRQQLGHLPPIAPERTGISRLAAGLLKDWGEGALSASELQVHLANVVADGLVHPMVQRLAAVGEGQHAHAGLLALLDSIGVLELLTPLQGGLVTHLCLPSSLVHMMHRDFPAQFPLLFGADTAKLRGFWTEFLGRPRTREWAQGHPWLANKGMGDLVTTIPCSLHSDAGPCSKRMSCTCISWSSLLSVGAEKVTQHLIYSWLKEAQGGRGGMAGSVGRL